jgi:uncharacterized MAPEG superfamily protein
MDVFGLSVPTILLMAIAAAFVVVYLPFLVVAYGRLQLGYNEIKAAPRAAFDQLPDYAKRATWAHQNSWEAFAVFSVAALMAYVTHQDSMTAAIAAILWIVARSLFSVFYIANVPLLRSLMFGVGSLCSLTLIGLSLIGSIALDRLQ